MHDTNSRSLVKTISWRLTGSGATFTIAYLVGGNMAVAGTIATVQIIINTILYFIHERLWDMLTWGKIE